MQTADKIDKIKELLRMKKVEASFRKVSTHQEDKTILEL